MKIAKWLSKKANDLGACRGAQQILNVFLQKMKGRMPNKIKLQKKLRGKNGVQKQPQIEEGMWKDHIFPQPFLPCSQGTW